MAEPDVVMRSLDEPRNIGHGDPGVIRVFDNADDRMQRCERIWRDLRPRSRNRPEQRRFAGVRIADQTDIRDGLELEADFALLPGFTGLPLARRAVGLRGETRIAASAASAAGDDDLSARFVHIGDHLASGAVGHDGADRHLQRDVRSLAPVQVRAFPAGAVLRLVVTVVDQRLQALLAVRRLEDHVAAGAAVAAVRAAARNEFFAVEAAAAVAAVPRLHGNGSLIHKHGSISLS